MRGISILTIGAVLAYSLSAKAGGDGAAASAALAGIFADADSVTAAFAPAGSAGDSALVHTVWREGAVVGRALVVDEMGKHGPITMLVAVDTGGAVREVSVLASREKRGKAVARPPFLNQFRGKQAGDWLRLGREIDAVTGATYSSRALVSGVGRALAVLAGVAPRAGG